MTPPLVEAAVVDDALVRAHALGLIHGNGLEALRGVDLCIRQGEFVSIVGPSGCGKSTLLRVIAGLLTPTSGEATVGGLVPPAARRGGRRVGFVFQDANLLPWRTVARNVALPLELGRNTPRASGAETRRRVEEVLQLVGLADFARAYPHELSGGMRMRVSLARALVIAPDVLLLDEPFGALDEITRQRLNEELLRLWEAQRWTALFVTHNVYEAVFLSGRVLVMTARPGRIAADLEVPFSFPRSAALRAQPEFARLAGEVSERLAEAGA